MYGDGGERFERPVKTAYKISIHESKRISGVVTKKQFVVTTVNYYTFATGWFALGEYDDKVSAIAVALNVDMGDIYDILEVKISPLEKRIQAEFEKTEEYITTMKHKEIIKRYHEAKALFSKEYTCPETEYDFCFNIFGELMNEIHFEKIKNGSDIRRSYQEFIT